MFDQPTVDVDAVDLGGRIPNWVDEVRETISEPGPHLAFDDDGEPVTVALAKGWTRIGRSAAADIKLDDPTVSRRHALVVRTPEGDLRALDDRSLNGLFVNGRRVEWSRLGEGDELEIGRYRLFVLEG
ncbi:MAG TPA: FHA domain-containing protein [Solirubrobacterales bacterium]|nr:FHA domain-containing protein [Solirubrobacterales bacterium]